MTENGYEDRQQRHLETQPDAPQDKTVDTRSRIDALSATGTVISKPDPLVGTVLDGYIEIVALLGQGGMSTVYKAKDLVLKRFVAVKIMKPHIIVNDLGVRRFQQEAVAASHLNHPNIIKILSMHLPEEGQPYLVMELVEGRSLAELIALRGSLDVERVLSIMSQACSALFHAHNHGVIHRDLKPSNIMLSKTDHGIEEIKIVDFGIAKILEDDDQAHALTQTGEVFGSPLYMSPEQCIGKQLDARSDIYSLGCVMYEALTGKPPLKGVNALDTLQKQSSERPKSVSIIKPNIECANELNKVLYKALAKDPALRYQTMYEMQSAIEAVAPNQFSSSSKHPVAVAKGTPQWGRGKIVAAAAAAVVVFGTVASLALFFKNSSTHPPPSTEVPDSHAEAGLRPATTIAATQNKKAAVESAQPAKHPQTQSPIKSAQAAHPAVASALPPLRQAPQVPPKPKRIALVRANSVQPQQRPVQKRQPAPETATEKAAIQTCKDSLVSGQVAFDKGDYAQAEEEFNQALTAVYRLPERYDQYTVAALEQLDDLHAAQGTAKLEQKSSMDKQLAEAQQRHTKFLEKQFAVLRHNENNLHTEKELDHFIEVARDLSREYCRQNPSPDSLRPLDEALKVARRSKDAYYCGLCLHYIGLSQRSIANGVSDEVKQSFKEAQQQFMSVITSRRSNSITHMWQIESFNLYGVDDQTRDAELNSLKGAQAKLKKVGRNHEVALANIDASIANYLHRSHQDDAAQQFFEEASELYERNNVGPMVRANWLGIQARAARDQGHFDDAAKLLQTCIALDEGMIPTNYMSLANSLPDLASCLHQAKKNPDGEAFLLKRTIAIIMRVAPNDTIRLNNLTNRLAKISGAAQNNHRNNRRRLIEPMRGVRRSDKRL